MAIHDENLSIRHRKARPVMLASKVFLLPTSECNQSGISKHGIQLQSVYFVSKYVIGRHRCIGLCAFCRPFARHCIRNMLVAWTVNDTYKFIHTKHH